MGGWGYRGSAAAVRASTAAITARFVPRRLRRRGSGVPRLADPARSRLHSPHRGPVLRRARPRSRPHALLAGTDGATSKPHPEAKLRHLDAAQNAQILAPEQLPTHPRRHRRAPRSASALRPLSSTAALDQPLSPSRQMPARCAVMPAKSGQLRNARLSDPGGRLRAPPSGSRARRAWGTRPGRSRPPAASAAGPAHRPPRRACRSRSRRQVPA